MRIPQICCIACCLLAGCHRLIELGDSREVLKDRTAGPLIIKNRPILMHFKENDHDFDGLIGANFERGQHARAYIKNSFSQFYVETGWVYLVGKYPFVDTPLVATHATGTTFAVQIDGNIQRIYLLSDGRGDAVKIDLAPGVPNTPGKTKATLTKQHYVTIEADGNGNYSAIDSGPIKGDTRVAPFIQELRTAVDNAGLLSTWPANLPEFFIGIRDRLESTLMQDPLGLIAGEGVFPLLVARGARAAGRKVVCAGLSGSAWPELREECPVYKEVGVLRIGQWIRVLKTQGCREAIMVGRVAKEKMYSRFRYFQYIPDGRALRMWFKTLMHDKSPAAVLRAVSDELSREGITLIDSTKYCAEHLATAGVMTKRQPTETQWQDIRHGWEVCRMISKMDIGQAIGVLNKDVIAVEALEGTNAMIERAGQLCKAGGWTLIKVANTQADMRMDVPSIGTTTIEKLHQAGAACVVLEPGKTIILEKQKVLDLADRYKIAVVGFEG